MDQLKKEENEHLQSRKKLAEAGENKYLMSLMTKSVSKTVRVDEMFNDYMDEKNPVHLRAINETEEFYENKKKEEIQFKVALAKI